MQKLLPEAGQGGISPPFFKEGNAEFLLQLVNGMAQRGLGDIQLPGGGRDPPFLRNGLKIQRLSQIQNRSLLSSHRNRFALYLIEERDQKSRQIIDFNLYF